MTQPVSLANINNPNLRSKLGNQFYAYLFLLPALFIFIVFSGNPIIIYR